MRAVLAVLPRREMREGHKQAHSLAFLFHDYVLILALLCNKFGSNKLYEKISR